MRIVRSVLDPVLLLAVLTSLQIQKRAEYFKIHFDFLSLISFFGCPCFLTIPFCIHGFCSGLPQCTCTHSDELPKIAFYSTMADALASMTPEQLAQTPAATPPSGVTPNFVNPPSTAPVIIAISSVLMAVMFLFAGGRFYVKIALRRKITPDDCESFQK